MLEPISNFFRAGLTSILVCASLNGTAAVAKTYSEAEIDAMLRDSAAGPVYAAVEEYFPDEAAFWRAETIKLLKAKEAGTYQQGDGIDIGAQVRRRHSAALALAPDEDLRQVMGVQYTLHAVFRDDPDACGRLLMGGPKALTSAEIDRIKTVLANVAPVFKAMHAGETTPVTHPTPSDQDWGRFYESYLASGFSDADFDLVVEPNPQHPRICEAFLGFFGVLRDGDFPGAAAIRAQVVPAIVGS